MASLFSALVSLSTDPAFVSQIKIAITKAAVFIMTEPPAPGPGPTVKNQKRWNLAYQILTNPDPWVPKFALAVASLDVISAAKTDTEIYNAVSSIWNAMAGVTGEENK
jgi:hypothetical protein